MGRLIGICAALLISLGALPLAADPPSAGADAASPPPIKEVTIDPNVKEPVCRREAPTGSRIFKERCTTPGATVSSAEREQQRRDLDEMRTRAAMRDQARAAAEQRRRAGF